MCGIIGYVGNRRAAPILLKGLKHLEYRGYDSVGIALLSNKDISIKKDVGKVDEVSSRLNFLELEGSTGVAHCRWATHGAVTQENAHPHTDCSRSIVVVHNGIIENHRALKDWLLQRGHEFKSETDTEVISHLIEEEMKSGKEFVEAAKIALKKLEGSYALLVMHKDDNKMIAVRKGSPLVLGVSDHGYFAASDIPAFIEHTKKVVYLSDYDFVTLTPKNFEIFNLLEWKPVERKIDTIDWDAEQAKKGEFEHFMMKEIAEQVETVQRAVQQDRKIIDDIVEKMKRAKGIFLIGCGSSYHACLAASYIFSKIAKFHVNVILASEFPNYEHFLTEDTLVIAVSQSGETYDVLEAVRSAKKRGSKVISIVNVMGSSLTRESDAFLMMHAGPEICVLSTKTYTSQIALLSLLAYALAGKYEEGKKKLTYLWNVIYHLTSRTMREKIKELAEKLRDKEHIFCIGRGLQFATALEAALKIKEVSYIHAEAFAGGELKHGTIALIEDGTPCLVFTRKIYFQTRLR
jgi:glucosamine--fructose-6-phosphate aminotransferase (isomerizing)